MSGFNIDCYIKDYGWLMQQSFRYFFYLHCHNIYLEKDQIAATTHLPSGSVALDGNIIKL